MDEIETKQPVGDRRDELISRVIDGEATESDWSALRAMAEADPSVWTELTKTQHQHEALCCLVDEVGMIAEGVEIPEGELLTPAERFERRMAGVRAWGGWAAAAAILLVWFTGLPAPTARDGAQRGAIGGEIAEAAFPKTPDGILDQYMETGQQAGRVLGQVPQRVVLETRPAAQGVEVVYLRQIIEREIVGPDRLYRLSRDEFGTETLVPDPKPARTRSSY